MLKRISYIFLVFVLIINFSGCKDNKKKRYEAEFLTLFDTVTKIVAYTDSKDEFTQYSQLIYDNLKQYHELYDIYNDYDGVNNIKTINDNAGIKPVKVDKKIIDLLLFARNEYSKTSGKINIAFGAVTKIWHDYRTEGIDDPEHSKLPKTEELKEAAKHTDINNIIIDENESTVYITDPALRIDVGAVGKGYAAEQVSGIAIESGFTSGLISVGGNVRAIGVKNTNGSPWNVGIQNPDKDAEDTSLKTVYVDDLSVVTSGIYQRYYTVDGKTYHHIIDPETLYPTEYFKSITIICRNSGVADALSTAVFNMPYEQGLSYIESLDDTEALWVFNNGEIKYSSGFEKLLKK